MAEPSTNQPLFFVRPVPHTDQVQLTVVYYGGPRFTVYITQESAAELSRQLCIVTNPT